MPVATERTTAAYLARKPDDLTRFAAMFTRLEAGCWAWAHSLDGGGYGMFSVGGASRRAHLFAFINWVGPIPVGFQLDHCCHTEDAFCPGGRNCHHRRCVNPQHLEPVPPAVNIARGLAAQRAGERERAKTHCVRGHPYDEANTYVRSNGGRKCRRCNTDREIQHVATGSRRLVGSRRGSLGKEVA